ncbi:MAG TPA: Hpt domain-containing protein [Rhodocyclaceae bacterium]
MLGSEDFDVTVAAAQMPASANAAATCQPRVPFDYGQALKAADQWVLGLIAQPFRGDWPQQIDSLRRAQATADTKALCRVAHTLRGLAANFNAVPVLDAAGRLEGLGHSRQLEAVAACIDHLEACLRSLDLALAEYPLARPQGS